MTLAGRPEVSGSAFVAAGAVIVGDVTVGDEASVWYNAVLRADTAPIFVGARSNLQDLVACHADPGFPLQIGAGVTVGHGAVLHGCLVEDDVLIGMHATVLNGAVIGEMSIVAAGALVSSGVEIPAGSLVVGVPGRVVRPLNANEIDSIRRSAADYVELAGVHRA